VCPTVAFRSDRLRLRRLDERDAEFVEGLYADPRVTRTLLQIQEPISRERARELCRVSGESAGDRRLGAVLVSDEQLIALGTVRRSAERPGVATIGYSVLPEYWGQGFGTGVATLLVE
jgi:RimJ/RimL family protein N-acetyltransferase